MDDEPSVKPKGSKSAAQAGPMIRPARPGGSDRPLIPIGPGPGASPRPAGSVDPYQYWSDYYRKHDETAEQLRETVRLLNLSRKFADVHAALRGYLVQRPKNRESWIYVAYAIATEENQGKAEDVKTSLNYAADMAQRSHNPNDLVRAADQLYIRGYYDRVGALLDEAATKIPHRAEPLIMMINLAQKTKDANRMSDAIDRLLSLGWPGNDEYFRREAHNQADRLASTLREEGRGAQADALLARLPAAEARDVFIRLSWDGNADFDLIVQEPLGATAQVSTPRTVFGGSIIKNGYGNHPEEVYVCPRGFDGDYTVRIAMVYSDPKKAPTRLTLETVIHEGTAEEHKETHTLTPDDPKAKPVVVHLQGGRRKLVLPFLSPAAAMEAMTASPEGTRRAKPAADRRQPPANEAPKASRSDTKGGLPK
jgi:hypothetical protein